MRYEKLKVFVVVVFKRHRVYAVISDRSSCVRCSVQTTMTRRQVDPQVADRHLSSSKYSVEMRPTRPGQRHSLAEMLLNSRGRQQLDPFENWGQNPRGGGRIRGGFPFQCLNAAPVASGSEPRPLTNFLRGSPKA